MNLDTHTIVIVVIAKKVCHCQALEATIITARRRLFVGHSMQDQLTCNCLGRDIPLGCVWNPISDLQKNLICSSDQGMMARPWRISPTGHETNATTL